MPHHDDDAADEAAKRAAIENGAKLGDFADRPIGEWPGAFVLFCPGVERPGGRPYIIGANISRHPTGAPGRLMGYVVSLRGADYGEECTTELAVDVSRIVAAWSVMPGKFALRCAKKAIPESVRRGAAAGGEGGVWRGWMIGALQ